MPRKPERPPIPKHDAAYRSLFALRRTVADTLHHVAPDLARGLDFATIERLPASFVTKHLGQRHVDTLWRVRATTGKWFHLLLLFEHQSTVDRRMAVRMLDYTVRVLLGLDDGHLDPHGQYPFVLPVVVYNGERRWSAAEDVRDLFAPVPAKLLGHLPRQRYLLIELQALDPASPAWDSVLSMIVRLEQVRSWERLEELVIALPEWVERAGAPELLDTFETWVAEVLVLKLSRAGREQVLKILKREGMTMGLYERARRWAEEDRQQWLEEGIAQGVKRGRREGIEKGIARQRALVRRLAARRFGPEIEERLVPVLDDLSDPERIAAIADAVLECRTAEEFMARASQA